MKKCYLVTAILMMLAPTSPTPAAKKPADVHLSPAWTIAFERKPGIWTAHGDGSAQKCVIRNGSHPCWSPDKKSIAFERNDDIWIAHADGTHQRQLTHHRPGAQRKHSDPYKDSGMFITWNRMYNLITFSHTESFTAIPPGGRRRYTIESSSIYDVWPIPPKKRWYNYPNSDIDTGVFTSNVYPRITPNDTGTSFAFSYYGHPAWSYSGNDLAFSCNGDIWIMNTFEDHDPPPNDKEKMWNWDCTRLASTAEYDAPNWHASRMNLGISRLSWSPDGRQLAYSLSRLGGSGIDELHLIETDKRKPGTNKKLLDFACDPCFSPDGKLIAYEDWGPDVNYQPAIFVISLEGKRSKLISNACYPAW